MANQRQSKSGTTGSKRTGGKGPTSTSPSRPSTARPASSSSRRDAQDPETPASGGYAIPVVLGVALAAAVGYWIHTKNAVPSEPATMTDDSHDGVGSANGAHAGANNNGALDNTAQAGTPRANTPTPTPTPPAPQPNAPVQQDPQNVAVEPAHPDPTSPDPVHGPYTLAQATAGLPAGSNLVADIETSMGTFHCNLLPEQAPLTVANFVGLARGLRDFWDPTAGRWTRRPYFDGSVFHRVIPGFMIQGGDILRSGRGGPGYTIPDENVADHDSPGLLCMANRGPNTGGSQFFITEVPRPHLNGSYSVFGRCEPADLVGRIARTPRSVRDVPIAPVYIQHVTIHR